MRPKQKVQEITHIQLAHERPASYVRVIFLSYPKGSGFTAGEEAPTVALNGEWGFRAYTNARGVLYHGTRVDPDLRYPPYISQKKGHELVAL